MAQIQIDELPASTAAADHEVPTQQAGTTYKVDFASIRDWISSAVSAIYDPQNKKSDVYDRANHTGVQALSTVTNALSKAGDTMTGPLILPHDTAPANADQAVTKAYVQAITGGFPEAPSDNAVYGRMNATWTKALPLTGGTVSGTLDTTGKVTIQGGGLQVTGGLIVSSGGMTLSGAANFGSNSLTVGAITASGQVSGANLYTAGTISGGYLYCAGLSSSAPLNVTYNNGALNVVVGSAGLQFSTQYTWNSINVFPSSYALYIAFAGNNFYTMQTDRFAPMANGGPLLGTSTQRWDRVYSVNADSVTSDSKLKKDVRPFTAEEVAAARAIFPLLRLFKWKNEASGTKLHAGVIAQDMETLFAEHSLDITQYAFYEIEDDFTVSENADGTPVDIPTGTQTRSIVYPELLVWLMAALAPPGA